VPLSPSIDNLVGLDPPTIPFDVFYYTSLYFSVLQRFSEDVDERNARVIHPAAEKGSLLGNWTFQNTTPTGNFKERVFTNS